MYDDSPTTNAVTHPDPALVRVARTFLPGGERIEAVAGRPYLVRIHAENGWWKVRRWPEATTRARVEFVHRVLGLVAGERPPVASNVLALADGAKTIVDHGVVYDCQSWLVGEPVAGGPEVATGAGQWAALPAAVSDETLINLLRTLATAHARAQSVAGGEQTVAPPLTQLLTAVTQAWKAQRGILRPLATATPAVRRWLATGERALPAAEAALGAVAEGPDSQTVCHLGLWPAHVIVVDEQDQDAVAGLIGWEQCNVGSPLIDLAQVISRCRGWSAAGAELAIAAYSDVTPLRPEDRRLLPAVAALDLVATSGRMLILAYGGRPGGTRSSSAAREAARSLLDSLDVATNALLAQDRTKRSDRSRGWRPAGPPRGDRAGPPRRRRPGPQKKR
jgi:Ser/Thr protein kinase RdoA (MazF antagonist)